MKASAPGRVVHVGVQRLQLRFGDAQLLVIAVDGEPKLGVVHLHLRHLYLQLSRINKSVRIIIAFILSRLSSAFYSTK